jgi:hypothetical protein
MPRKMLLAFAFSFVFATSAEAFLGKDDLQKSVYLTEEAALLTQIDAVSLHLSSDKVSHAPRLNEKNVIEVDTTVLDSALLYDREALKQIISRYIETFIATLKERLPVYAPSLAKSFSEREDIVFNVSAGSSREPLAKWSKGKWAWLGDFKAPEVPVYFNTSTAPMATEGKGKLGCNCPARRK